MLLQLHPHVARRMIICVLVLLALVLLCFLLVSGSLHHGIVAAQQELAFGPTPDGGYKLC